MNKILNDKDFDKIVWDLDKDVAVYDKNEVNRKIIKCFRELGKQHKLNQFQMGIELFSQMLNLSNCLLAFIREKNLTEVFVNRCLEISPYYKPLLSNFHVLNERIFNITVRLF